MLSLRRKSHRQKALSIVSYERLVIAVVLATCLTGLGIWLFRIIQNIDAPAIEYSEGFIVYLSQLFGSGQWQYTGLDGPPFQTSFYTPLFYLIHGGLGGSLITGRLLDILCALVSMGLVSLIIYHITKSKALSLIGALLPATQFIFIQWSLILKTDLMALMFELAGIYVALRFRKSPWLLASIPLFTLAFFTKQSFIAGPLAVAVYLWLESRNRGSFAPFVVGMVIIVLIPLVVLGFITEGEFLRQMFLYQRTDPMFQGIVNYGQWLVFDFWTLLPALIMGMFFAFNRPKHLLTIYAGVSILIALASIARPGSSQIYMFETIFALALIAPIGLNDVIRERSKYANIYIAMLVIIPLITMFSGGLTYTSTPDYERKVADAQALIADADYPILTENANMVLDAGKSPYLCDPFVFMNLASLGMWDEQPLLDDLNSQKIDYVITQTLIPQNKIRRLTWSAQDAIQANYHIIMDCSEYPYGFVIYKANNGEEK